MRRADWLDRARSGLLAFTLHTKADFELNWHHKVMCRYLDGWLAGTIPRLIITAPPRCTKSEFVSRRMPALFFGMFPAESLIIASYAATLAQDMNRDVQRIITSPEYAELFPDTRIAEAGAPKRENAEGMWARSQNVTEIVGHGGKLIAAGIRGSITGKGGNVIVDDPFKNWEEASSPRIRQKTWEGYSSVLYTRLPKNGRVLITVTRWHEDDLVGRAIELQKADPDADQWTVLHLPAINENGPSKDDPREVGDALWPARYPLEKLEKIRRNSEAVFVANYQNRPAPAEGNLVKRTWWQYYTALPEGIDAWAVSFDGTFKDKEKSDFAVFQLWARKGASKYLVRQVRARMAYVAQRAAMRELRRDNPQVTAWFLEDSALAAALKSDLDEEIPGIILVPTKGVSKIMRAEAIAPQIQAGNVFLPANKPEGQGAPEPLGWVQSFIAEWSVFPNGANDDQVDATSLAISQLSNVPTHDAQVWGEERDSGMDPWRLDGDLF